MRRVMGKCPSHPPQFRISHSRAIYTEQFLRIIALHISHEEDPHQDIPRAVESVHVLLDVHVGCCMGPFKRIRFTRSTRSTASFFAVGAGKLGTRIYLAIHRVRILSYILGCY